MTRPSLRQLKPTEPYIQWVLGDETPEVVVLEDDCIAWLGGAETDGEVWATALGPNDAVCVSLIERLSAMSSIDGVTVPDGAYALLPDRLRSPDAGHWCFWVYHPEDAPIGDSDAIDLAPDDPRIAPLLEHSDSAHIFPGDPRIMRWVGIEEDGRLLSVAAQRHEETGVAHICSVCTEPGRRGEGLARRTCTRLMQLAAADGVPAIVLEMYAANEPARHTYEALGFREMGRYYSGLLRGGGGPR